MAACRTTAVVSAAVACAAVVVEGIGSTVVSAGAESGFATATGFPPGHSRIKRAPVAEGSMRGFSRPTGLARSKTMRSVSGVGWPVRTDLITPAPAGSLRLRAAWDAGRSTTRRSGPASEMVLYSPLPSNWISTRVVVLPASRLTVRTSPANAGDTRPKASMTPTHFEPNEGFPICMAQIQAPSLNKCNLFSLNNPQPAATSYTD